MRRDNTSMRIFVAAWLAAAVLVLPNVSHGQADPRVTKAMTSLKAKATALGAPKLSGTEAVNGLAAPALYFGTTKISNNFDIVDAVSKEGGKGMTATFFVRDGDEYIRVSTSVVRTEGGGRAIGTILDPNGKAIVEIRQGKPFYGEVTILGALYVAGYEPLRDGAGNVIGIYYVGYKKE